MRFWQRKIASVAKLTRWGRLGSLYDGSETRRTLYWSAVKHRFWLSNAEGSQLQPRRAAALCWFTSVPSWKGSLRSSLAGKRLRGIYARRTRRSPITRASDSFARHFRRVGTLHSAAVVCLLLDTNIAGRLLHPRNRLSVLEVLLRAASHSFIMSLCVLYRCSAWDLAELRIGSNSIAYQRPDVRHDTATTE